MKKLVIVGSGPTSMCAAVKLVDAGFANISILEKGIFRPNEAGVDVTSGYGGSGSFSDSKIILSHKAGGTMHELLGHVKFYEYLEEQKQIWLRFAPTDKQKAQRLDHNPKADLVSREFTPSESSSKLRTKALAHNMDLDVYTILHLGTDNAYDICNNIYDYLISKGVDIQLETTVETVLQKDGGYFEVITDKGTFETENVLVAPGRSGGHLIKRVANDNHLTLENNGIDIGVRVELPQELGDPLYAMGVYEPKFWKYAGKSQIKTRSFCYSADTQVYTKRGFILFNDVNIESDEFLSVNPETEAIEWTKATDFQKLKYKGQLINFKSKSLNLLVTPDHMMYVKNNKYFRDIKTSTNVFKKISEIKQSDLVTVSSNWKGNCKEVYFGGQKFSAKHFAQFMAWYLSEGTCHKKKDKPGTYYVIISQNLGPKHNQIIELLDDMKIKHYVSDNKIYLQIPLELKLALYDLGKSYEKYIPREVLDLDIEFLQLFIDIYVKGDGHKRTVVHGFNSNVTCEQSTIYTSSKKMADGLCEIILKIGLRPIFNINKCKGKMTKHRNGNYTANHDIYNVRMPKSRNHQFKVIKQNLVDYDDFVYDVTLEKNHTLLIQRDGKIWWGSNCYCPQNAFVAKEEYRDTGIATVNGHSYSADGASSGNLNFAVLATTTFTYPFHDPLAYAEATCRKVNLLAGGNVMVQRFGDLKAGRRSTTKRLLQGATRPSLDAEPGALDLAFPYRQLDAIMDFLDTLGQVVTGFNSDHALLYAPEVKFYSNKVPIDTNSMTTIPGLYVGGDGSGWTRGLNQASIQGLVVADALLKGSKC